MIKYETLYHKDENDNTRVWWMEQDDNKFRTCSGVKDGQLVLSEWKEVFGKNTGKKNATTDSEQATAEINSLYKKKLARKYHHNEKDIEQGSKIIEPMLAATYKGWDKNWGVVFSQPKLDGMRCIATRFGLFSRQGKPIYSCPHILEALIPAFEHYPDLVLDGELYNHQLRDNFNELLSIARQTEPTSEDLKKSREMIQYHVYDNMDELLFAERSFGNFQIISALNSPYIINVHTVELYSEIGIDSEYAELLEQGYEGQMLRLNKNYEQKRSKALLKRKEFIDEEFPVDEILEGEGNWAGFAKSLKSHTKDGVIFNAGIKGNQDFARQLLLNKNNYKWVTVRYQNKTPDGSLRFPIAVAFFEKERDV